MLLHQSVGLDAFNELPMRKAVHALYECCNSVTLAQHIAHGRPYDSHDQLFRRADALLFALPEESVDTILQAYPHIGRRPRSTRSAAEQCAVWDDREDVMSELDRAAVRYTDQFGYGFIMYCRGGADANSVMTAITDRLHHAADTERKVVRNELAKINRTRLERMLGPEGGYQNW